jgi:hypothetical protein
LQVSTLDQWQSASEFMLEPWVLLQLPFHPSLLHQWAVALLAETLKFQKDTVTIFVIGVPKELWEEAQLLKKMLKKLMDGAFTLLSIFCNFSKGGQQNICRSLRRVRKKLLCTIAEVTPIVEFILSDKCRNVISGIKRASWGSIHHHKQKTLHPMDAEVDFGSYHIWYNAMFWVDDQVLSRLFSKRKNCLDQHKLYLHKLRFNLLMFNSEAAVSSLQNFVLERIIRKRVLVGASDAEILAVVAKAPGMLQFPCFDYFTSLKGNYRELKLFLSNAKSCFIQFVLSRLNCPQQL